VRTELADLLNGRRGRRGGQCAQVVGVARARRDQRAQRGDPLYREYVMIPERCPCCLELIDTYGCACPPFEVRHALSNRSGRTYPNPDNGSDDVGVESQ
jgi:hypothetical protein